MPDLVAQGPDNQRWRRGLEPGRRYVLGRAQEVWCVDWDHLVSRRHAEVCWEAGRLSVEILESATNPIFQRGQRRDHFSIRIGEHFVIGDTTFSLIDEQVDITQDAPAPISEQSYSSGALQKFRFRNADQRIEVLSRLPEIISGASDETEMWVRVVNVLLAGITRASAAAIVVLEENNEGEVSKVLHWDRRKQMGSPFTPSDQLIRRAVSSSESVVHVWKQREPGASFTQADDADWAFCIPVPGDTCRGWAIYLAGGETESVSGAEDLRDDLKFAELAAITLGRLSDLRASERSLTSLSQFMSPVVLDAIAGEDPEVILAPREADVSVLFCDLRGFSRSSERAAGDLLGLLNRVSGALGVMTRHILEHGGIVGDFHGDAAMGFWGWPLDQEDRVQRACRAALAIRKEFAAAAQDDQHPLVDFRIGIGVASGRAVAGKIGTEDLVKITVFGPVVNLAARLEGMTKLLRAPILLDEFSAAELRVNGDFARVRRVARVRPYGLEATTEVAELLPLETDFPGLTNEDIAAYEEALDALQGGDWDRAFTSLHRVPAEDRVKDFLTVFIAQHNRTPPKDWDGVIPLSSKE